MSKIFPMRVAVLTILVTGLSGIAMADNHDDDEERVLQVYRVKYTPMTVATGDDVTRHAIKEMLIGGQLDVLITDITKDKKVKVVPVQEKKEIVLQPQECKDGKFHWAITGFAIPIDTDGRSYIQLQLRLTAVSVAAGNVVCESKDGAHGRVEFDNERMEFIDLEMRPILQETLDSLVNAT